MFYTAMAVYYVGMTMNCLLTPSPYFALHSGKLGLDIDIASTAFFISPAYIILGAEALTILIMIVQRKSPFPQACISIVLFFLAMLLSGIINTTFYSRTYTFLYNFLSIYMAYLIACHDSGHCDVSKADLRRLGWVLGGLALAGFGLCMSLPYRYGVRPFEFSRISRGEVTYWPLLSLHLLMRSNACLRFGLVFLVDG